MRENTPVLLVFPVCDGEIILEKGGILSEKRQSDTIFASKPSPSDCRGTVTGPSSRTVCDATRGVTFAGQASICNTGTASDHSLSDMCGLLSDMLLQSSRREQVLPRRDMMLGVLSHTRCRRVRVTANRALQSTGFRATVTAGLASQYVGTPDKMNEPLNLSLKGCHLFFELWQFSSIISHATAGFSYDFAIIEFRGTPFQL